MKKNLLLPIFILSLMTTYVFAQDAVTQASPVDQPQEVEVDIDMDILIEEEPLQDKYILVLKLTEDYNEAIKIATEANKNTDLEFQNESRGYSKEKGIYYTKDIDNRLSKGGYVTRQDIGEYISLENSSSYAVFESGYIVVIAGIYDDRGSAQEGLIRVKQFYPEAYVEETTMWDGVDAQ
ncbi:MAG: hypothetical protein ISS47_10295 [Candidatus Omnitrophica bacterium]|nr:hypothetical protein [Candidatus Omnitrophota bacterium]